MKNIYYFLIALVALVLILPGRVAAQGMMNFGSSDTETNQNLSDDEYEKLGEQWMELMMGDNHEAVDEQMRTMMGEDFLRQMHIAMGKRAQNPGTYGMMPMMGMLGASGAKGMGYGGYDMMGAGARSGNYSWPLAGNTQFSGVHAFLMIITWLTFIAFLLTGTRWFWKRANK